MRVPTGATALTIAIVTLGLLGLAIEAGVDDVASSDKVDLVEYRFESSTQLCPPAAEFDEEPWVTSGPLWVASGDEAARVGFEPQEQETIDLPAQSLLRREAAKEPVDVVGYDAPVTAGATFGFAGPGPGAGAAACSSAASDLWYFAQGSTENEFDQRLILYNPFPEEASVRVTLYLKNRTRAPSLLSDLAVPANDYAVVSFVERADPSLGRVGAEVEASRGRIVAWRSMVVDSEGRARGGEFTLGAPQTSRDWYFPDGTTEEGAFTSVNVLNPNEGEASVRVSLLTPGGRIEHPSLEQIVVPPTSARPLDLERVLRREDIPETFGVVVRSSTPVVAERTIGSTGLEPGRSAEVGAIRPATSWTVPPVGVGVSGDRLIVMNPGEQKASVEVALARAEGPPIEPEDLRFTLKRGRTRELSLEKWQGQGPFAAIVTSSHPVVVERAGQYRGDLSALIGVPEEK